MEKVTINDISFYNYYENLVLQILKERTGFERKQIFTGHIKANYEAGFTPDECAVDVIKRQDMQSFGKYGISQF